MRKVYRGVRVPITLDRWRDHYGWTQEEAEQMAAGDTVLEARVFVREVGKPERPLPHHSLHSPGGFEWGYDGSGPAELARCILLDHFGADPSVDSPLVGATRYHDFKRDVIAALPKKEEWEITSAEIDAWIERGSSI